MKRFDKNFQNSLLPTKEEAEIIKSITLEYRKWVNELSEEEKRLIRKYTLNSFDDKKPNRFFERLNRALKNKYHGEDFNKLIRYGKIISDAICKHPIEQQITCYRGVDYDSLQSFIPGDIISFDQFVSTSVISSGALKKRYKYVILAPQGTKGAYIEEISAFQGQYEFLLDYSCEYRLIKKKGHTAYLEVII